VSPGAPEAVFIKDGKQHHQVRIEDLLYVEAMGPYASVVTRERAILTQETITELEKRLSPHLIRVHKSFLVSPSEIRTVMANSLRVGEVEIPIGRVYKPNVTALLS